MNIEYEKNFFVDSVDFYVDYCKNNGYTKIKETWQNRIVFENEMDNNLIARITKEKIQDKLSIVFDCKKVLNKNGNQKESQESTPLEINENNLPAILSMLQVMGFKQSADNERIRYVYQKDLVIFEIDKYLKPQMNIVAIEGEKSAVDELYSKFTNTK